MIITEELKEALSFKTTSQQNIIRPSPGRGGGEGIYSNQELRCLIVMYVVGKKSKLKPILRMLEDLATRPELLDHAWHIK